jgi:S1-C subfamily serine protease
MIKCAAIPAVLLCLCAWSAASAGTNTMDRSVVEVLVTYQRPDSHFPWRRERPGVREGYGVVIGKGRVITTEDLVRNHSLVELRRPRSGAKLTGRVVQADYQFNAALIEFGDPAATEELVPVRFAARCDRAAKVEIAQFDESGQIQTGEGHVAEISVDTLPNAPVPALTFRVLTDLKIGGVGAPVFCNQELVGLVMRYDRDNQSSLVLPAAILSRFVADVDAPPYKGCASAGLLWTPLVDPAKRAFLGVPEDQKGILVLHTIPGLGAAAVLRSQDVIVEWDGHPLDAQGYYDDPDYGRLLLPYLINGRRKPGDTIPLTIIRDRQRMTVQTVLRTADDRTALIPQNVTGEPAEFLVDGGFVLRELSGDYLYAYGSKWMIQASPRLVNLFLTRAQLPEKEGEHVVLLSSVIPDPINVGYQQFRDEIISHVNGSKIDNLADVFRIVERDGGIRRLTVHSCGVDLVLDPKETAAANERLAKTYRIPQLRYHRQ